MILPSVASKLDVSQKDLFRFDVKGEQPFAIQLYTNQTSLSDAVSLVTTHSGDFTTCNLTVWDQTGLDFSTFQFSSTTLLTSDLYEPMWYSWRNGDLQLGFGDVPYTNTIFSQVDPYGPRQFQVLVPHAASQVEWQYHQKEG